MNSRSVKTVTCGFGIAALSLSLQAQPIALQIAQQKIQPLITNSAAQTAQPALAKPPIAASLLNQVPELSFVGAQVYIPLFARGGVVVGAPAGGATFSLQESDQAPGTQLSAGAPPSNLPVLAVRSCKDAHRAVLTFWVKNSGADFDAVTPDLGVTGTLAGQAVQSAIGKVPGSPQNQMRNIEGFQITPGAQSLNLILNKARGGGEANFANNEFKGNFEIRCTEKSAASGVAIKPFATDISIAKDAVKPPTSVLVPLGGASTAVANPSSGNELQMIELQSMVSKRATAVQMTTNVLNSMNETNKEVAKNVGGGSSGSPNPSAGASAASNTGKLVNVAGNISVAKVIQFNKSDTNLSLKNEPDSTVLVGPNGERKTIGEVKQLVKSYKSTSTPSISETSAKALTRFQEKIARITTNLGGGNKAVNLEIASSKFDSASDYVGALKTCKEQNQPPKISKVLGDVTPGAEIIIRGSCFEAQPREVRLSGQNLKAVVRLNIKSWNDYKIVAQVPAISGAIEGSSELQVITIDEKSTVSFPVGFTPAYELVDVSKFFSSCNSFEDELNHIQCFAGSVKIDNTEFTGAFRSVNTPYTQSNHFSSWDLNINKNCTANDAWTANAQGKFTKFEWGVSNTSTKEALKVNLTLATWLDKYFWGDTLHYVGHYKLAANAYCPVGISPGS
jgi:IPT/TIG domain